MATSVSNIRRVPLRSPLYAPFPPFPRPVRLLNSILICCAGAQKCKAMFAYSSRDTLGAWRECFVCYYFSTGGSMFPDCCTFDYCRISHLVDISHLQISLRYVVDYRLDSMANVAVPLSSVNFICSNMNFCCSRLLFLPSVK